MNRDEQIYIYSNRIVEFYTSFINKYGAGCLNYPGLIFYIGDNGKLCFQWDTPQHDGPQHSYYVEGEE